MKLAAAGEAGPLRSGILPLAVFLAEEGTDAELVVLPP
jgi:hypothetical protein